MTKSHIQLPIPTIKPFDKNDFILTMINWNLERMGKLSKVHVYNHFFIESKLRAKYNEN